MRTIRASELTQGMTVQTGDTVVVTLTKVSRRGDMVELVGNTYHEKTGYRKVSWSVKATQRVTLIAHG